MIMLADELYRPCVIVHAHVKPSSPACIINASSSTFASLQPLEGNAWHADHIIPVYKGGGMCQLDNLRTLCVPCHQVC